ncbi:YgeY family selenium metabolism-linked hydrolase [Geomicrobium sediminis]|uniref:Probable succinyl-diaminopimelate desuccinylase n=1 Tax=Geomicrobium sediminis TaxID=1347788 RepID=A0ABS2PD18_9BACL|nr:YgeY family selenium metabolism-linked hydrolase [Geomicrobium sediminis]MBM7633162.1 putative selenium metabolism hydrolase [Geomicrobium sediminis]
MEKLYEALREYEQEIVEFVQQLVRIKSFSGDEKEIAHTIKAKMESLDFDKVWIDSLGNVVGRVGNGENVLMFDSHMDTVEVHEEDEWELPPFAGEIKEGRIYGRGSVDMKSSIVASIYAAKIAKDLQQLNGKAVYITCTVDEEFCDGENLKQLFKEFPQTKPNYMIICEPSDNKIVLGHRGKAQLRVKTFGTSAHGSAPEKGDNAVYKMAEVIRRVEEQNHQLMHRGVASGTLVLSNISSTSASLNAVPSECEIYLDRRLVLGEDEETVKKEMDHIVNGLDATWEIGSLHRTSWKGANIHYEPLHEPWKIAEDHPLTKYLVNAYEKVFSKPPAFDFWDFGTNAVTPVSEGIPTIGFGPGEYKLAHMNNESCEVKKIHEACAFYVATIAEI